jgi:hypothetical protein
MRIVLFVAALFAIASSTWAQSSKQYAPAPNGGAQQNLKSSTAGEAKDPKKTVEGLGKAQKGDGGKPKP